MLATCNVGAPDADVDAALRAVGLRFVRVPRPLSERELRQEISNGRPVLVKRATGRAIMVDGKVDREHHMFVVTGYDVDRYHVLDPAPKGRAMYLDYATLLHGDGHQVWRTSWTYLSFRPEACDPRFNPRCTCGR
jgi:hypothetical protein